MSNGMAGIALFDMPAQRFGAACHDGAPSFGLRCAKGMCGKVGLPVRAQDVGQFDAAASAQGSGRDDGGGQEVEL